MWRMKRRTWLRAVPLSVLLPASIAEAMEQFFLQEKRQGEAWPAFETIPISSLQNME